MLGMGPDKEISLAVLDDPPEGEKPNYPYPTLAKLAIHGSERKRLTLQEIYTALEDRFEWFRERSTADTAWKVRSAHSRISILPNFHDPSALFVTFCLSIRLSGKLQGPLLILVKGATGLWIIPKGRETNVSGRGTKSRQRHSWLVRLLRLNKYIRDEAILRNLCCLSLVKPMTQSLILFCMTKDIVWEASALLQDVGRQ
jgi:hypothetical protein